MIEVTTLTLGSLETNCYLISEPVSRTAFIIDPADQGDLISEKLLELKLQPQAIILTHGHFDHCLACLEIKLNFHLPIYLHPADHAIYRHSAASARHFLGGRPDPIPPADEELSQDQILKLGQEPLQIIHTPGHTPGSVCLYSKNKRLLFTGDTLFADGVGDTSHQYSSSTQLDNSLKKLARLIPIHTLCYPGHGELFSFDPIATPE